MKDADVVAVRDRHAHDEREQSDRDERERPPTLLECAMRLRQCSTRRTLRGCQGTTSYTAPPDNASMRRSPGCAPASASAGATMLGAIRTT